jgi:hypothetical protein
VNAGTRGVDPRRPHDARLNMRGLIYSVYNGTLRVECYGAGLYSPVET